MITFDLMYDNLVVMTIIIMSAVEAFIFSLIESGDEEELLAKLQELEDAQNSLSYRNNQGKTALDLAALLGKAGCAQVLVENGADLNKANTSGYTALHQSAAWGRLECLKKLVSLGADHLVLNQHSETARAIALRYGKTECMEYLDAVDSRFKLSQAVKSAKNTLGDSEKISGKWNKDDRSKVNGLCNETNDWLQYNQDALSSAVQQQIADFEAHFEPYLAKLTPPDI